MSEWNWLTEPACGLQHLVADFVDETFCSTSACCAGGAYGQTSGQHKCLYASPGYIWNILTPLRLKLPLFACHDGYRDGRLQRIRNCYRRRVGEITKGLTPEHNDQFVDIAIVLFHIVHKGTAEERGEPET